MGFCRKNIIKSIYFPLLIASLLASSGVFANVNNPFSVIAYGNFTQMIAQGKAPSHASLMPMAGESHLYGLGALESLHGEITLLDGDMLISRSTTNDGHTSQVIPGDNATLFATAKVNNWSAIAIPTDLDQPAFEAFVLNAAHQSGIKEKIPFPFLVKGGVTQLHWHVVTGFNSQTKSPPYHPQRKQFNAANINGTLLGFYTGDQLDGVISHPNEKFHVHFTDASRSHAGHVDSYHIASGATLFLPKD